MIALLHSRISTLARAACVALALWCVSAVAAPPATEEQLKAVYLFNFGQFVEWPEQAFESKNAPFVIGILGADGVGDTVEKVVRGESLAGRRFEVRRFGKASEIDRCHILFIGRDQSASLDKALEAIRGRSVLTVTDIAGAEHRGAVVALFNENNRIRMRINLDAAKAGDLVISSKLLRPAEIVGGGG